MNACATLHNMQISGGVLDDNLLDEQEENRNNVNNDVNRNNDNNLRPLALARRIQDQLIEGRFGR